MTTPDDVVLDAAIHRQNMDRSLEALVGLSRGKDFWCLPRDLRAAD